MGYLPTHIFKIADRDPDGYYEIHSSTLYCFEFKIDFCSHVDIFVTHTDAFAQDWSLLCWASDSPDGPTRFREQLDMSEFRVPRTGRTIRLVSDRPETDTSFTSCQTNYLMIKNLQNSPNRFQLKFGPFDDQE